jgi:integrase
VTPSNVSLQTTRCPHAASKLRTRLRFLEKRGCCYIVWTEGGRSRERSTGTADRRQAEIALAEFIHLRNRDAGPRDPSEVLVTDALADYALEHGEETGAPWRIAAAIKVLAPFWEGRTVAEVTRETCRAYEKARARSAGTVRRELGVLRASINHEHKNGRLTRVVAIHVPDRPEPRDRWLTRKEAAALLRAALSEPRVRLHLPLFILVGLYSGARKEGILSLRWSQVDLQSGRIDIRRALAAPTNAARAFRFRRGCLGTCAGPAGGAPRSASSSARTGRGLGT